MMRLPWDISCGFVELTLEDRAFGPRRFSINQRPYDPAHMVLNAIALAASHCCISLAEILDQTKRFVHGTAHAVGVAFVKKCPGTTWLIGMGEGAICKIRFGIGQRADNAPLESNIFDTVTLFRRTAERRRFGKSAM